MEIIERKDYTFLNLDDKVYWVSWIRLILYLGGYFSAQLLQLLQGDFLSLSIWQPINLIVFSAMILHYAYLRLIEIPKFQSVALHLILAIDALLVAQTMWFLGSYNSVFLFAILLWVVLGGLTLGLHGSIRIGLVALAGINLVWSLSPNFDPSLFKGSFLLTHASVLLVGGLSGYLGEHLRSVREDIKVISQEMESLQNFNDLIVENMPSGIFLFDRSFRIIRSNRGAAKIFSDLSLEGKNLGEISAPLRQEAEKFVIDSNTRSAQRLEIEFHDINREKLILEVIFSALNSKTSNIQNFICLVQNLTEIKNLEFAMQQKEKLAAVGQLAAGIAHEIRNPLASISGSVQLLSANLVTQTEEDKKLFNIVLKEIDRLNKLITEFLDFVRPELRIEDPVSLNQLAKEVLEIVKLQPNLSKKVTQHTELRSQNLIFGHYDKLKQAFLNVIINSYQAMTDTLRPEVFVQTYDNGDHVVIVVKDNGSGMSKENLKRIFEPFHTTKPSGTGLGLAITHKILEAHQAQVNVESELGQGTTFMVSFPVGKSPTDREMYLKKQA